MERRKEWSVYYKFLKNLFEHGISFDEARFSHFIDSLRDDLFHLSFLFLHITSLFFVNNIFVHKLKKGDCVQYNKVEICGINTGRLKVLKEKEKMELLKKAQAGDKNARNELVEGNLRLVLSVVQRFSNRGENMDDLFQVGVIGLIKAIDNFNTDLDVRFSTYAVPMCIGEIRRYLRDDNPIRVSRSMRDTAYKAMQVKEQLINENGKEPTIEEIAQRLEMKKSDVVLALEAIVDPVSLYEPVFLLWIKWAITRPIKIG